MCSPGTKFGDALQASIKAQQPPEPTPAPLVIDPSRVPQSAETKMDQYDATRRSRLSLGSVGSTTGLNAPT